MNPARPGSRVWHAAATAAVALVCVALYAQTLNTPFVFDDLRNIAENRAVRVTELNAEALRAAAFDNPNQRRPVAFLTLALNYYVGGYAVQGYHVVNILIHALNGVLVYVLAFLTFDGFAGAGRPVRSRRPGAGPIPMATVAALLFAAHPLQTQAVTYTVQRVTSLATMFYLLSLLLYIAARLAGAGAPAFRRWLPAAGAGACWILALGSKEIAAALPVTILLYEGFFFQNLRRDWLRRAAGLGLLALALLAAVAWLYLGNSPLDALLGNYELRDFTLRERLLTQVRVVVFYLGLWLLPLPARLNVLHAFPTSHGWLDPPTTAASLVAIIGLLLLAARLVRGYRVLAFGIFWFFLHLVMESSVIPLEMVFEHRLYLPSVGLALAASQLVFELFPRHPSRAIAAASLALVCLGVGTLMRNQIWQDDLLLWSDVVAKSPESKRAHLNLGVALASRDRLPEAVTHFRRALEIEPRWAPAHMRLAISLDRLGQMREAEEHLRTAVRLRPDDVRAHSNLGLLLGKTGRIQESLAVLREALRIDPAYAPAHVHLAIGLELTGSHAEAIRHFEEALRLDPDRADAAGNLAWILATCEDASLRDPPRSLEIAEALVAAAPTPTAALLDTLATAQAANGDREAAIHTLKRALELTPEDETDPLRQALEQRLRAHRTGRP